MVVEALSCKPSSVPLFFFNDTATTEIYTLSLHDALPISRRLPVAVPKRRRLEESAQQTRHAVPSGQDRSQIVKRAATGGREPLDRKSTRLNSSHGYISYAVFCLKKKRIRIPESPWSHATS